MYKTVRHGENSLQYTILPQQEEAVGVVGVRTHRCGKRRTRTAAVLAVTIILICGVIATAVLVPLLLTSDLVALPAAFQKFSISSLRRSHNGNQMVVVAKKPHGWSGAHHTPQTTSSSTTTTPKQDTTTSSTTTSTTSTTTTTTTTAAPTTTITTAATTLRGFELQDLQMNPIDNKITKAGKHYIEISTTTIVSQPRDMMGDGMIVFLDTGVRSTSAPTWNWPFQDPATYFQWTRYNAHDNLLLPIMVGGAVLSMCVMVLVTIWLKKRRSVRNRSGLEKTSTEAQTGDKATLLKESGETEED